MACATCNKRKGNRTPEEAKLKLRTSSELVSYAVRWELEPPDDPATAREHTAMIERAAAMAPTVVNAAASKPTSGGIATARFRGTKIVSAWLA